MPLAMINITNTVVVTVGTASQMKTVQMTGLVLTWLCQKDANQQNERFSSVQLMVRTSKYQQFALLIYYSHYIHRFLTCIYGNGFLVYELGFRPQLAWELGFEAWGLRYGPKLG